MLGNVFRDFIYACAIHNVPGAPVNCQQRRKLRFNSVVGKSMAVSAVNGKCSQMQKWINKCWLRRQCWDYRHRLENHRIRVGINSTFVHFRMERMVSASSVTAKVSSLASTVITSWSPIKSRLISIKHLLKSISFIFLFGAVSLHLDCHCRCRSHRTLFSHLPSLTCTYHLSTLRTLSNPILAKHRAHHPFLLPFPSIRT